MGKIWQLGNTTVRSALRIRDGLIAYKKSGLEGRIRRADGDAAFRNLLGSCGVVSLGEDVSNSVGRKWRSAMAKLGFIYPEIPESTGLSQNDIGPLDYITQAGNALIEADTTPAIQEVYLRAMVVPTEKVKEGRFSPLVWTLKILLHLERKGENSFLSFSEFALFVQTSTPEDGYEGVCRNISNYRTAKKRTLSAKRFKRDSFDLKAKEVGYKSGTTRDYADEKLRYLKATGMFRAKGNGIILAPERKYLAIQITGALISDISPYRMYRLLCEGADLPTDSAVVAKAALGSLVEQAEGMGIECSFSGDEVQDAVQINRIRYRIEEQISRKREREFASRQKDKVPEIIAYLELLAGDVKKKKLPDGNEIALRKDEAPAYFEWTVWRAFLAVDNLVNEPFEVRRFNVDGDFLPVSTAPGNGPDLIAEFAECILAIEVTLSTGSRQEAMEGEPVRRHVARLVEQNEKPVIGLFIAVNVDTNTIETFRHGIWYTTSDERLDLNITPLSLAQFTSVLKVALESENVSYRRILELMNECCVGRGGLSAPVWRTRISDVVDAFCAKRHKELR